MRKAFLFRDIAQFTLFVREHAAESQSKRGYLLYRVRDPDRPSMSMLVLVGYRKTSRLSLFSSLFSSEKEVMVEEDESGSYLVQKKRSRNRSTLEILDRLEAHEMMEFLVPGPWREEPLEPSVLFRTRDPLLVPAIVSVSLRLGRDRVRVGQTRQGGATLYNVQIEDPSQFLLAWCTDELSSKVEVWRGHPGQLYTPWGLDFPLLKMWQDVRKSARGDSFFLREDGEEQCPGFQWEAVSNAGSTALDLSSFDVWREDPTQKPRLDLPLELAQTAQTAEAEVWLLEEEKKSELERLLTMVDEEDLESISFLEISLTPTRRLFVLRERVSAGRRKFIDFGGQRFRSYKGFQNLLLPTSLELLPSLRRDQYRKLFGLPRGEWTVLWPDPLAAKDGDHESIRVLQFQEAEFAPLQRLLDYNLPSEEIPLEEIEKGSPFDFEKHKKRFFQARPSGRLAEEGKPSSGNSRSHEREREFRAARRALEKTQEQLAEEQQALLKREERATKKDPPPELRLSELEEEERSLQVKVIREGQTKELWQSLFGVKYALGNAEDAIESGLEALWLDSGQSEKMFVELQKVLHEHLSLTGVAEKDLEPLLATLEEEFSPHHLVALLFHGREITGTYRKEWLQKASRKLREEELRLRKKVRWLLWVEYLQQNKDVRELARVRESLLEELNEEGIQPNDIPAFLQTYLTESRHFVDNSGLEGADERLYARQNLELLEDSFEKLPSTAIRAIGLARFAWCFAFIQEQTHAEALCNQAFSLLDELSKKEQAWVLLFGLKVFGGTNLQTIAHYQKLFKRLRSEFRKSDAVFFEELEKVERTLDERREVESPADFLSKENLQRLEPPQSGQETDEYSEAWKRVERAQKESNSLSVLENIQHCFQIAEGELDRETPRLNRLFQVVRQWIETLGKYRGHAGSRDAIEQMKQFTSFLPVAPPERLNAMQVCYYLSLKFRLAKGLLPLNMEQEAVEILGPTLVQLAKHELFPVDYIDLCGLAIPTIELVSLENRQELLTLLIDSLVDQLTGKYSFYYEGNDSFLPWFINTIDQLAEAAMSKDKIAQELYRQYCDHDELLVRERVLREELR